MATVEQSPVKAAQPRSLEAERAVLGAILWHNEALYTALEVVRADHFSARAHRHIFEAMSRLGAKGEPIDELTLTESLTREGVLGEVGGAAYLAELTAAVASAGNIRHHAEIVREKHQLRRMLGAAQEISASCCEGRQTPGEILDRAQQQLFTLSDEGATSGFVGMKPLVKDAFTTLEDMGRRGKTLSGVPSGYEGLDHRLLGFQKSDLIILAARPSVGKTAFGLNIAANAAVRHGAKVGFFSLEMSSLQLTLRMLCAEAEIDAHQVRTGAIPRAAWTAATNAAASLSQAQIFIDDSATLSPLEMRARARRLKQEHGCDLIIVDYLQLMRGNHRAERRDLEIGEISRSLKALAKELNVPVIALAQLSRRVEEATGGPKLSHLRESGAIEQDADVVLFLHRDPDKMEEDADAWPTDLIIAKHRNGPVGKVDLWFVRRYARFMSEAFEYGQEPR